MASAPAVLATVAGGAIPAQKGILIARRVDAQRRIGQRRPPSDARVFDGAGLSGVGSSRCVPNWRRSCPRGLASWVTAAIEPGSCRMGASQPWLWPLTGSSPSFPPTTFCRPSLELCAAKWMRFCAVSFSTLPHAGDWPRLTPARLALATMTAWHSSERGDVVVSFEPSRSSRHTRQACWVTAPTKSQRLVFQVDGRLSEGVGGGGGGGGEDGSSRNTAANATAGPIDRPLAALRPIGSWSSAGTGGRQLKERILVTSRNLSVAQQSRAQTRMTSAASGLLLFGDIAGCRAAVSGFAPRWDQPGGSGGPSRRSRALALIGRAFGAWSARTSTPTIPGLRPHDRYRRWNDEPYGGGAGMVLKPRTGCSRLQSIPLAAAPAGAADEARRAQAVCRQQDPAPLAGDYGQLVLLAARHYEGFDERIRGLADGGFFDSVISLLTGGEAAGDDL